MSDKTIVLGDGVGSIHLRGVIPSDGHPSVGPRYSVVIALTCSYKSPPAFGWWMNLGSAIGNVHGLDADSAEDMRELIDKIERTSETAGDTTLMYVPLGAVHSTLPGAMESGAHAVWEAIANHFSDFTELDAHTFFKAGADIVAITCANRSDRHFVSSS